MAGSGLGCGFDGARSVWSEVPRQQLLDSTNGMIRYAREHVPQIAFWIKPIQFSRSDQAIEDGSMLSPGIGPGEQIIFPTQSYGAQGTLGGVVIRLQATIVAVPGQRRPQRQGIADRRRRIRLAGKFRQ